MFGRIVDRLIGGAAYQEVATVASKYICLIEHLEGCTKPLSNTTILCHEKGVHLVGCSGQEWGLLCKDSVCAETHPYWECHYNSIVVPGACQ